MIKLDTTIYSNSIDSKRVVEGGNISRISFYTTTDLGYTSKIDGKIDNQKFVVLHGANFDIRFDPEKDTNLDLEIKGVGTIIIEKYVKKMQEKSKPKVVGLAMRLKRKKKNFIIK